MLPMSSPSRPFTPSKRTHPYPHPPSPSKTPSAFDTFPAPEFDAWISRIQTTINNGLKPPQKTREEEEREWPMLSEGAVQVIRMLESRAPPEEGLEEDEQERRIMESDGHEEHRISPVEGFESGSHQATDDHDVLTGIPPPILSSYNDVLQDSQPSTIGAITEENTSRSDSPSENGEYSDGHDEEREIGGEDDEMDEDEQPILAIDPRLQSQSHSQSQLQTQTQSQSQSHSDSRLQPPIRRHPDESHIGSQQSTLLPEGESVAHTQNGYRYGQSHEERQRQLQPEEDWEEDEDEDEEDEADELEEQDEEDEGRERDELDEEDEYDQDGEGEDYDEEGAEEDEEEEGDDPSIQHQVRSDPTARRPFPPHPSQNDERSQSGVEVVDLEASEDDSDSGQEEHLGSESGSGEAEEDDEGKEEEASEIEEEEEPEVVGFVQHPADSVVEDRPLPVIESGLGHGRLPIPSRAEGSGSSFPLDQAEEPDNGDISSVLPAQDTAITAAAIASLNALEVPTSITSQTREATNLNGTRGLSATGYITESDSAGSRENMVEAADDNRDAPHFEGESEFASEEEKEEVQEEEGEGIAHGDEIESGNESDGEYSDELPTSAEVGRERFRPDGMGREDIMDVDEDEDDLGMGPVSETVMEQDALPATFTTATAVLVEQLQQSISAVDPIVPQAQTSMIEDVEMIDLGGSAGIVRPPVAFQEIVASMSSIIEPPGSQPHNNPTIHPVSVDTQVVPASMPEDTTTMATQNDITFAIDPALLGEFGSGFHANDGVFGPMVQIPVQEEDPGVEADVEEDFEEDEERQDIEHQGREEEDDELDAYENAPQDEYQDYETQRYEGTLVASPPPRENVRNTPISNEIIDIDDSDDEEVEEGDDVDDDDDDDEDEDDDVDENEDEDDNEEEEEGIKGEEGLAEPVVASADPVASPINAEQTLTSMPEVPKKEGSETEPSDSPAGQSTSAAPQSTHELDATEEVDELDEDQEVPMSAIRGASTTADPTAYQLAEEPSIADDIRADEAEKSSSARLEDPDPNEEMDPAALMRSMRQKLIADKEARQRANLEAEGLANTDKVGPHETTSRSEVRNDVAIEVDEVVPPRHIEEEQDSSYDESSEDDSDSRDESDAAISGEESEERGITPVDDVKPDDQAHPAAPAPEERNESSIVTGGASPEGNTASSPFHLKTASTIHPDEAIDADIPVPAVGERQEERDVVMPDSTETVDEGAGEEDMQGVKTEEADVEMTDKEDEPLRENIIDDSELPSHPVMIGEDEEYDLNNDDVAVAEPEIAFVNPNVEGDIAGLPEPEEEATFRGRSVEPDAAVESVNPVVQPETSPPIVSATESTGTATDVVHQLSREALDIMRGLMADAASDEAEPPATLDTEPEVTPSTHSALEDDKEASQQQHLEMPDSREEIETGGIVPEHAATTASRTEVEEHQEGVVGPAEQQSQSTFTSPEDVDVQKDSSDMKAGPSKFDAPVGPISPSTGEPGGIALLQPEAGPSTARNPLTPPLMPHFDSTRHIHSSGNIATLGHPLIERNIDSPAARTRSQCVYHKLRFGTGEECIVALVPACSIGSSQQRREVEAEDAGKASLSEMALGRKLGFSPSDPALLLGPVRSSQSASNGLQEVPEVFEHQLRKLVGADVLREGSCFMLLPADEETAKVQPMEIDEGPAMSSGSPVRSQRSLGKAPGALDKGKGRATSATFGSPEAIMFDSAPPATEDRKRKRGSSATPSATGGGGGDGSQSDVETPNKRRAIGLGSSPSGTRLSPVVEVERVKREDEDTMDDEVSEGARAKDEDIDVEEPTTSDSMPPTENDTEVDEEPIASGSANQREASDAMDVDENEEEETVQEAAQEEREKPDAPVEKGGGWWSGIWRRKGK